MDSNCTSTSISASIKMNALGQSTLAATLNARTQLEVIHVDVLMAISLTIDFQFVSKVQGVAGTHRALLAAILWETKASAANVQGAIKVLGTVTA